MARKSKESTVEATQIPEQNEQEIKDVQEVENSTTKQLFPELFEDEQEVLPENNEEKVVKEEPTEQKTAKEPEAKYLDDFSYRVKTKIAGEEKEVTVEELKRGYQTAQFLTKEGQRLAEERKRLDAEKLELDKLKNPDNYSYDPYSELNKSEEQKRLERIEAEFANIAPMLGNIKYQEDIKVLDLKMKQEGLDDFPKYVSKVEEFILNQPIEKQQAFRTFEFYESFYKTEKLKEYKSMVDNPKRKLPDERPNPNVMSIENPSANISSNEDDGYGTQKQRFYDKAVTSGKSQDWQNYFDFVNKSGRLIKRPA